MAIVREGKTSYQPGAFVDKDGVEADPSSAEYRIDCLTSGTVIKDWTALATASGAFTITIPPSENALVNSDGKSERRRIRVRATYAADDKVEDAIVYELQSVEKIK